MDQMFFFLFGFVLCFASPPTTCMIVLFMYGRFLDNQFFSCFWKEGGKKSIMVLFLLLLTTRHSPFTMDKMVIDVRLDNNNSSQTNQPTKQLSN